MKDSIGDDAATKFAIGFYDSIFAGTSFRMAFDIGCSAIDLHNLPEADVPVFLAGPQLGGTGLSYTQDVPEIEDFLKTYLNTPYSERYRFTTTGQPIADTMARYYSASMPVVITKATVSSKKHISEKHWKVAARIHTLHGHANRNFFLRINDHSIKLEWEASVGLWSVPVKTYLALGSDEDVLARVKAELDNSYYGEFSDKEHLFQSVALWTMTNERLYGYVRRGSVLYDDIMEMLDDGNEHELTLTIRHPTRETDNALIVDLLSKSWIYHPPAS